MNPKKLILEAKFRRRIIQKGYTEEEANELIKERNRLQDKIFQGEKFVEVDETSSDSRRLDDINHIIFGAK